MSFHARTAAAIAAFLVAGCTVPLDGPNSPVTSGTYQLPLALQDDPSNRVYANVSVDVLSGDVILTVIPYHDLVIRDMSVTITDPKTGRFRQTESFSVTGGRVRVPNLDDFMQELCGESLELRADVIVDELPYRSVRTGIIRLRIPPRCEKTD